VGEFLTDQWLPGRVKLRATTRARYTSIVNRHLVPELGATRLQELTADRLTKWYRRLTRAGLAPKTVRNVHGVIHKALKDAVKRGLVSQNVADVAADELPDLEHHEMRTWSQAQLNAWLASVQDDRLSAAWRLVAYTGLRRGEVLGLRWDDVDLANGAVRVSEALVMVNYTVQVSRPKTERSRRTIALDAVTLAALRGWRKRQNEEHLQVGARYVQSGRVFTNPDGSQIHPQRFSDWFEQRARAAKVPVIRLHDVRHTHASRGLEAGVPLLVMSRRLGHVSSAFTADVYGHVLPAQDKEAAEQIAALADGI
jgi:integrase